jgi:hypothetical protein
VADCDEHTSLLQESIVAHVKSFMVDARGAKSFLMNSFWKLDQKKERKPETKREMKKKKEERAQKCKMTGSYKSVPIGPFRY